MECPICGTAIDEDKYKVLERLASFGYMHLDVWVKCPNPECKYTPCFGKELEDPKPIYWAPKGLPKSFRDNVVKAFHKHVSDDPCPFCSSYMELHKVWVHTWRHDTEVVGKCRVDEDYKEASPGFKFIIPTRGQKKKIDAYFLPSGILCQVKCTNSKCKYVRYITL